MFRLTPSLRVCAFVPAVALLASCGGGDSGTKAPEAASTPAAAPAANQAGNATVSGKGPASKGGAPTIVILKASNAPATPVPATAPVMDQIQLAFTPTILFTRPGQPAEFRNSDSELHNIRVLDESTKEPAFNVALPTGGTYRHTFDKEGFYDVGCDIHPGMSAIIVTAGTPFVTVAGADGQFSFADVPPGEYQLTVYADVHKYERNVTVAGGTVDIGPVIN